MNRVVSSVIFAIAMTFAVSGCAVRNSQPPCACGSVTMNDLKPMIGRWHGKSSDGKKIEVVTREVSGGTAIEETLSPGTPHEMVSLYTADGSGVQMTHYCMLGNQPVLKAQRLSSNELLFQFTEGRNIVPGKGTYMNEMKLTFVDDKHIREEWSAVTDGKKGESVVFDLWGGKGCSSGCKTKAASCSTACKTAPKGKVPAKSNASSKGKPVNTAAKKIAPKRVSAAPQAKRTALLLGLE